MASVRYSAAQSRSRTRPPAAPRLSAESATLAIASTETPIRSRGAVEPAVGRVWARQALGEVRESGVLIGGTPMGLHAAERGARGRRPPRGRRMTARLAKAGP